MKLDYKKNITVNTDYDVIVVGGGPSGTTAAAAAAREGAKTLIIEASGSLGGMGTIALVPAWCPFSDFEKIIYKSLAEDVFNASKKDVDHLSDKDWDWVSIDPERLKRVYDELVIGHGADVLFNTLLMDVQVNNQTVTHIITANKAGLTAYQAPVFIDCTGDADLAAYAGAEYMKGDEEGQDNLQPATLCFSLTNVDMNAYPYISKLHGENPHSVIHKILKDKKYPLIPDGHIVDTKIGPNTVGFNAGHIWGMDSSKPETVSKGMILGRKMAYEFRNALAEYVPKAFANAFLVNTGQTLGLRESRRVIGEYIITLDDYAERKIFEDEICRSSYFIDVHGNMKVARAQGKLERYGFGDSYGIPYRALTPRDLNNVLVAGRSVSADRMVQGSLRVMPVCLAMGEAAGIAATLALKTQGHVKKIDVEQLRRRLLELGAYIK